MAKYYEEISRTFNEYLLIPKLTKKNHKPENIDLSAPMIKFKKGEESPLCLKIPMVSAIMQSVSDDKMGIALATMGGLSFIYCSQSIEDQVEMIKRIKKHKAGFVISDSNLLPSATCRELNELVDKTGHSTVVVTENGKFDGKLSGIITSKDFNRNKFDPEQKVCEIMTPVEHLVYANNTISLHDANSLLWEKKLDCLPIVDSNRNLLSLVFRKDYLHHNAYSNELIDSKKRLIAGAGINTWDYKERVPALLEAEIDVMCIDSSDGYNEYQAETLRNIKKEYGEDVRVGAGNVISAEGFRYLVDAGADFIKVGVGGGAICITREQKGIGMGQATALKKVSDARDAYFEETGIYIPLCSDGGLVNDYHINIALAMGADFVMMGRYFARFDESPSKKTKINNTYYKEYWGEGTNRARNFQRYNHSAASRFAFEEGVDGYVPYYGSMEEGLNYTLAKIKSTFCSCGSLSISEFHENAELILVSTMSLREGNYHDIMLKE